MIEDIVPGLLENIKKEFNEQYKLSPEIKKLQERLDKIGTLSYEDAYDYSAEVGDILVSVFKNHISPDSLPDGKMYYNIAERVMTETLENNHDLVATYSQLVQSDLNKQAGYNIKGKKLAIDPDKIDGFIQRLASEELFADIEWILDEPVRTYTNAVVDDTAKLNAEFNSKLGIKGVIERAERYDACSWCRNLEGVYEYPDDVPEEVFHRHENCRGRVLYKPFYKRKAQNVHTKKWY